MNVDPAVEHVDASLRDRWPALGIARQRAIIAAVFDRIVIHPAKRLGLPPMIEGVGRVDLERVEVIWRA